MMDDEREYWETHCWYRGSEACRRVATFQGPQDAPDAFTRAWRACNDHRFGSDERLSQEEDPLVKEEFLRGEERTMTKIPEILKKLAENVDGTIEYVSPELPDGSGFATMSRPLPLDHWSTKHSSGFESPPMPFRMGNGPRREAWASSIRAAGQYAYRAATMEGQEPDLDPDALLRNLVVGMLGYWTEDGLSKDSWANPTPPPPFHHGQRPT